MERLQAAEPLPASVIKAIAKELKDLQDKPEEGIRVCPTGMTRPFWQALHTTVQTNCKTMCAVQLILSEDNIADVQAEYEGPGETSLAVFVVSLFNL